MKISGDAMISLPAEWCSPIQASSKPSRSRCSISARSPSSRMVGLTPAGWNGAMKIPKRIRDIRTASLDLQVGARPGVPRAACRAGARRAQHGVHDRSGVGERRQVIDGNVELRLELRGRVELAMDTA